MSTRFMTYIQTKPQLISSSLMAAAAEDKTGFIALTGWIRKKSYLQKG